MSVHDKLDAISDLAARAQAELADTPSVDVISELLDLCGSLDQHYRHFCASCDDFDGLPEGTAYNAASGLSLEFYIEADDWHRISLALRKLGRGS